MMGHWRRRRDERLARLIAHAWREEWDRLNAKRHVEVQLEIDGESIVRSLRKYKRERGDGDGDGSLVG